MAWKVNRLCVSLILGMGLALSLLVVFDTFVAGRSEASILDTGEWEVHITPTVAVTAASYSQDRVGRAADMVPQGQVQSLANPIPQNAIGIDGERERWGLDKTYLPPDPIGDNGGPGKIDWITVTMAHDCDELYVRYQLDDGPSIALEGGRYDLFVDVDRNRDTGYRGEGKWLAVGADALVQGTTVFSFTGTTQEDWSWKQINGYPVNDIPGPSTKRDIEFKVQIADLDRSGGGLYGFDWVLWADHTWGADPIDIRDSDIYPDGGAGGATGDFYTYVFERPVPFANPERGFVRQTNTHDPYGDLSLAAYRPLVTEPGTSTLKCYREWDGVTLLHRNFWLGEYVTSTISQEYLEKMQADFDTVRDAGLKAVIRFAYTPAYTDPITCAGESDRYDASKSLRTPSSCRTYYIQTATSSPRPKPALSAVGVSGGGPAISNVTARRGIVARFFGPPSVCFPRSVWFRSGRRATSNTSLTGRRRSLVPKPIMAAISPVRVITTTVFCAVRPTVARMSIHRQSIHTWRRRPNGS